MDEKIRSRKQPMGQMDKSRKGRFQPSDSVQPVLDAQGNESAGDALNAWLEDISSDDVAGEMAFISDEEMARILSEVSRKVPSVRTGKTPRQERRTKPEAPKPEAPKPEAPKQDTTKPVIHVFTTLAATVVLVVCMAMSMPLVQMLLLGTGTPGKASSTAADKAIMDRYDMLMTNNIAGALDGILAIEKVYWLDDNDLTAPEPDPANYGQVDTPAELMWLLEEAKELIGDRELTFSENTPVWELDKIYYYYDETILVITWKQSMDGVIHTVSEVIVSHPSQFRRALAGGEFGSDKQFLATEIAQSVNAVVATSGDFYKFRRNGIIVYNGELRRFEGATVDTCFIDDNGDMLFVKRGEIRTEEQAKQYIEDNNVRFSLAFGPVMVENGKNVTPYDYEIGQIRGRYTRSAMAQKGQLHYLFVNTSSYMDYNLTDRLTLSEFTDNLIELGAERAYALDGGQTTVIAMGGELISVPDFGYQRQISDIIYFATAIPDGE